MSERFTDSQMLRLVEIYREYEYLWNVNSDMYKNREARDSAYEEIAVKLNIPGVSARDVPRKIKNLRSSYYQELKRIQKRTRAGAAYKPRVSWFTTADGFLRAFRNKQETFLMVPTVVKSETISESSMDDAVLSDNLSSSPGPSRQQIQISQEMPTQPPPYQPIPQGSVQSTHPPSRFSQRSYRQQNQTSQNARRRVWRRDPPMSQTSRTLIEALNQRSQLDHTRNEIMQQLVEELKDLKEILKTRLPLPELLNKSRV